MERVRTTDGYHTRIGERVINLKEPEILTILNKFREERCEAVGGK